MKPLVFGTAIVCALSLLASAGYTQEILLEQLSAASQDEPPEFGVLFQAAGVEETFYTCTACHSERIIAQQGQTRAHWDELLVWMVDEQEMDEIEEPDRSAILDYLAEHYGEDRPNFPKPGG